MNLREDLLSWQTGASCAGVGGNGWFPKPNGSIGLPVLRICARCPVRHACAAYAVQAGEEHGVWAGLHPQDLLGIREQVDAGGDLDALVADALARPEVEDPTRRRRYRPVVRAVRGDDDALPDAA